MTQIKRNGQGSAQNAQMKDMMFNAPMFAVTQKMALETARFSARRMRAYADQMEALSKCDTPQDVIAAQTSFFTQMQSDYLAEGEVLRGLISEATPEDSSAQQR